ncbi:DUF7483 domain-containing protein [Halomonas sp. WWR20]
MFEALAGMGGKQSVKPEEVFSTTLYTGSGGAQTINNGIDLAGEGGLVWIKGRDTSYSNVLNDTVRGANKNIYTDVTNAENPTSFINSFRSSGFNITGFAQVGANGNNYASWTFRKAPKFFDIVKYTGDGVSGRQIAHDLGIKPGMIVVKRLDSIGGWLTYHRSIQSTDYLQLQSANHKSSASVFWSDIEPTDNEFTLGLNSAVNGSGGQYIAYLFAHDPSDSGIIQCGSYTGNGSSDGPMIELGWQPQYIMIKGSDQSSNWFVLDSQRSFTTAIGVPNKILMPNSTSSEFSGIYAHSTASGFKMQTSSTVFNQNGGNFIYMAIRAFE